MPYYAVYEDEDNGERFVVELEGDIAPIHVQFEDGTVGERVSLLFEAASIETAAQQGPQHCFA